MSIENLKDKSEQNFEVAEWAEKRKYYDVAISRYYYGEYQKIIYISKKMKFYIEPKKSEKSHIKTIDNFVASLKDKLSNDEKITILYMKKLRRYRNDADYKEVKMCGNDFSLVIKFNINNIRKITNKFL